MKIWWWCLWLFHVIRGWASPRLATAFAPANWSNWALVFVGGAAAIAALKTLTAIKRQVDLMENSERARMNLVVSRLGNFSFEFNAKNIGRTSARVSYARGFSTFLDPGKVLPDLPRYLSDEDIGHEPIEWVGPAADLSLVRQTEEGKCEPMLIADLSSEARRSNIRNAGCQLWVYGRIVYTDGISPNQRETRFCYGFRVDVHGETLYFSGGPPQYFMET